jgi:acyl dehydratase
MDIAIPPQLTVARLGELAGLQFQPTEWVLITQAKIDAFAQCTGDDQFIHIDPERARTQTPFGGTVAHGFLLLSLVAGLRPPDFPLIGDLALVLNYGIDRLRFISPVPAGSRVRYQCRALDVTARGSAPGGPRMLLRQEATLEIEGQSKPALIVELLALYIARAQ